MYCGLYKDSTLLLYANALRFLPWLDGTLVPNCHHNSHHNTQAKWCVHYSDSFVSKLKVGSCQKNSNINITRAQNRDAAAIQHYTEYGLHGVHISPRVIAVLVSMRIQDDCSEGIHLSRNTNTLNIEQYLHLSFLSNFFLLPPPFPNQQRFLC